MKTAMLLSALTALFMALGYTLVRRRRDERHARSGVTQARDHLRHLEAGKLAALAGLCALGDLDLKLLAGVQIFGRHPEAAARDLLDDRIGVVAVPVRRVARAVFPAFARHGLSADAVHGEGPRPLGFGRRGAPSHLRERQ